MPARTFCPGLSRECTGCEPQQLTVRTRAWLRRLALPVSGCLGAPGSLRGVPGRPLRGHQPLRDPRQAGYDHAQGHPACASDPRRARLEVSIEQLHFGVQCTCNRNKILLTSRLENHSSHYIQSGVPQAAVATSHIRLALFPNVAPRFTGDGLRVVARARAWLRGESTLPLVRV